MHKLQKKKKAEFFAQQLKKMSKTTINILSYNVF